MHASLLCTTTAAAATVTLVAKELCTVQQCACQLALMKLPCTASTAVISTYLVLLYLGMLLSAAAEQLLLEH
jgi:hypothetical protein